MKTGPGWRVRARVRPHRVVVLSHDEVDRRLRLGLEVHRRAVPRPHLERVDVLRDRTVGVTPEGGDALVTATNAASASTSRALPLERDLSLHGSSFLDETASTTRMRLELRALAQRARRPDPRERRRRRSRSRPRERRSSVRSGPASLPRQLLCGRARTPLAGGALSRKATREVGLDEVLGTPSTLGAGATRVETSERPDFAAGGSQCSRRASSVRERTPSFA